MFRQSSPIVQNKVLKATLIIFGVFFTFLGVVGIFVPVLPTTPFLLLAAACWFRSSKRFYHWLLNNKYLGKFIRNYRENKGIPLRAKIISISLLWLSISYSIYLLNNIYLGILLLCIAIGVTIHLTRIRTLRKN